MTRALHYLLVLTAALVQEECATAIGPQDSLTTGEGAKDQGLLQAEDGIETAYLDEHGAASFLNETLEARGAVFVKAGLIPKWKGKMDVGKKLGAGAFGTAFIATLKPPCPAQNVVIKIQNAQGAVKSWMNEIIKPEMSAMKTLSSLKEGSKEYFVGLLDAGQGPTDKQFSMLLELANKGTLTSVMWNKGQAVKLADKTIGTMLYQMLSGLKVLEEQKIVHRDLKPDNVLVVEKDGQLHAKIADFGLACPVKGGSWSHCGLAGTPIYMAPEMFLRPSVVAPSNDIWAVGAMAYQFINPGAVMLPIIRGRAWKPQDLARAPSPDTYVTGSSPFLPFVKGLLQPKPAQRWSLDKGLKFLEGLGYSAPAPPGYALPPCFEQMMAVEPEPEPEPKAAPKPAAKPAPKPAAKPTPKPMPPKQKVKVQMPKDASKGELITISDHNGRERDAPMPSNAKEGDEVEIDFPEGEDVEQVVLLAGADQMAATALTKILEGKTIKDSGMKGMLEYMPKKLRDLDRWTIIDIGGMPKEMFMGSSEDAIGMREKLGRGDLGRAILLNVQFKA